MRIARYDGSRMAGDASRDLTRALGEQDANFLVGLHMRWGPDMLGSIVANRVSGNVRAV